MTRDAQKPEVLNYHQPDRLSVLASPMRWQFMIAYFLIVLPILYVGMSSSVHPVPVERAVTLYVLIGLAVGAGLFVERRQPRNAIGWFGFAG
jgi:hypothetical protein